MSTTAKGPWVTRLGQGHLARMFWPGLARAGQGKAETWPGPGRKNHSLILHGQGYLAGECLPVQVNAGDHWSSAGTRTDQLPTLLVMIMSNFNLQYECLDARDDYRAELIQEAGEGLPPWLAGDELNVLIQQGDQQMVNEDFTEFGIWSQF